MFALFSILLSKLKLEEDAELSMKREELPTPLPTTASRLLLPLDELDVEGPPE